MEIIASREIPVRANNKVTLILFDTDECMITVAHSGSTFSLHIPATDLDKIGANIQAMLMEREAVTQ